jgi:hypothetical protein
MADHEKMAWSSEAGMLRLQVLEEIGRAMKPYSFCANTKSKPAP